ncbi:hypothetical protein [Actinoplanes subglobosus]|uniref:Uncharacterized protein n=1 Tax=Actinoplanes subglobosus TaxID=1547892 RepID=A0ABV8IWU5_9ACTN
MHRPQALTQAECRPRRRTVPDRRPGSSKFSNGSGNGRYRRLATDKNVRWPGILGHRTIAGENTQTAPSKYPEPTRRRYHAHSFAALRRVWSGNGSTHALPAIGDAGLEAGGFRAQAVPNEPRPLSAAPRGVCFRIEDAFALPADASGDRNALYCR